MAELTVENLETVLRLIADAGPEPWYPKLYAEKSGVPRDSLDEPLEKLRLAGLVKLTDWVKDRGQGYVLTQQGITALQDAKILARVRDGKIKPASSFPKPAARPRWSSWDRGEAIREVFLDPPDPVVAKTILFITALLFVMGLYVAHRAKLPYEHYLYGRAEGPDNGRILSEVKHEFGGLTALDLARGQWWRLLTYLFLHHGVMHLLMNMMALFILSRYAEPMWGHVRFLLLYLVAGWGAGCIAMMITPLGLLAGASGSLCGILAAEAVWIHLNREYLAAPLFQSMMKNIFVNAILIVLISAVPEVSASAHFGGAAVGAIAAVFLHYQQYGIGAARIWAPLGVILLPLVSAGALIFTMHHSSEWQVFMARYEQVTERLTLSRRFSSDVAQALMDSQTAYADVSTLLNILPKDRKEEVKQRVLDDLRKSQVDLKTAAETFAAGPTMKNEDNEQIRKQILDLVEAESALLQLAEHYIADDIELRKEERLELSRRLVTVNVLVESLRLNGLLKKKDGS
jgi:rhomboid protease GluP